MNLLFICSRNQWRSRTAEEIFRRSQLHAVKSAGTSDSARIRVNEKMIRWADLIFVMEKHHRSKLRERFEETIRDKEIIILDIPDQYQYMDEVLIEMLENSVSNYISIN